MLHPSTILPPLTCCATTRRGTGLWYSRPFCWCLPVSACRRWAKRRRSPAHGAAGRGGAGRAGRLFLDVLPLSAPPNQKMGLPRPFYRLLLDDEGLSVRMAGEQDKPEASRKYAWHDMHLAYRTPNAIYLYVRQNQAYLLNDSLDAAWSLLQASPPGRAPARYAIRTSKPIAQLCDGLFVTSQSASQTRPVATPASASCFKSTCVLLAAAPTATPCFRHRRRSSLLPLSRGAYLEMDLQYKTGSAVERRRKRRCLCMRTPKHLRLLGGCW